jgi:hypothetical protein
MFGITSKSITNYLYGVLDTYGLVHYLVYYLQGDTLPAKPAWKSIVKKQINISEELKWKNGLIAKDAHRYWDIQQCLKPNVLYSIIKAHPHQKQSLMTLVKLLTIVQNDEAMLYALCHSVVTNSFDHVLMHCERLLDERNTMWDDILDYLDVHTEVRLVSMEDADIIQVILGKRWNGYKCDQDMYHVLCTVSSFVRFVFLLYINYVVPCVFSMMLN